MKNEFIENILNKSILSKVTKPARYTGAERNIIQKDLKQIDVRFLIAFPELYEIGMSSQATNILYHNLNKLENVWAERVFTPWPDMEEELRNNNLPLYSLESFSPMSEFDVIGFTLQYELTYTNILNMLNLAGIPVWSNDRSETDPLIIAGGPCTCNPEPVAHFFDAFLIGDGEQAVKEICDTIRHAKKAGKTKTEMLQDLAKIRGVYVPSFYMDSYSENGEFLSIEPHWNYAPKRVLTRIEPELTNDIYPEKPLVPLIEVTHDRIAIEVMRGCTEGCRFCNAGMIYRPTRERNEQDIVDYSLKALSNTGYEEISFLSLSISDYSDLISLMQKEKKALEGKNVNVSFPSMRLDSFNEEIAAFAKEVRKSGFTFAPESGSERLRKVINKNITDEDLLKAVKIALENGWKLLKFYFMIGLPTETKEDVESIGNLIEQCVQLSKKYGRVKFNVSISPHSPKSHTPFQWEKQDTKEEFWSKIDILKQKLYRFKQVSLNWRDPAVSEIESVLGRGDRRMANVIFNAWQKGAKFDGWTDFFRYETWQEAFNDSGLQISDYSKEIQELQPLPWDHIDKGVTKQFLLRERNNAYEEKNIIDCKDGTCFGCGIQRKDSFRNFAKCYLDLKLHKPDIEVIIKQSLKKTENQQVDEKVQEQFNPENKFKVRMQFTKTGYARYISHLDMVRIFDRACRQAQIPVMFSQGFNPRPKIAFCQPLALGQSSESEYLDMELSDKVENIAEKLNAVLPEGIVILKTLELQGKTDALTAQINLADYIIDIPDLNLTMEQINTFLSQDTINVVHEKQGKISEINLRPFIESINSEENRLLIRTKSIDGRTARVKDIISQLLKSESVEKNGISIHRKNQFVSDNTSFYTPIELLENIG